MRTQIMGFLVVCLLAVPALADEETPMISSGQSRSKLGSLVDSMREKVSKAKADRRERSVARPPLFSRSKAAVSGAASKAGLKSPSDGPLSRLIRKKPVRPWKSSIPIQRYW